MLETKILSNFEYYGLSDVGSKRVENQDRFAAFDSLNGHVFVVCDGMGGHENGALAAQIAVDTCLDFFQHEYYPNPKKAIAKCIKLANLKIWQMGNHAQGTRSMGTTIVLVLVRDNQLFFGHVGDSRLYSYCAGKFKQLTKDHSYVQGLIDRGELAPTDAEMHPRKNELTKALGVLNEITPFVYPKKIDPKQNEFFLLCSDGLTGMLPDEAIKHVLGNSDLTTIQKTQHFIHLANHHGGIDNITALLIYFFPDFAHTDHPEIQKKIKIKPSPTTRNRLVVSFTLLVVSAFVAFWFFASLPVPPTQKNTPENKITDPAASQLETIAFDGNWTLLAQRFNLPASDLKALNNNPNHKPDSVQIPIADKIIVEFHYSPQLLAFLYGLPFEEIAEANLLSEINPEYGSELLIPLKKLDTKP